MLLVKQRNNMENFFIDTFFYVSVGEWKCQEATLSGLASGLVNWPFIWRWKGLLTFAVLLSWWTLGEEQGGSGWSAGRLSSVSFPSREGSWNHYRLTFGCINWGSGRLRNMLKFTQFMEEATVYTLFCHPLDTCAYSSTLAFSASLIEHGDTWTSKDHTDTDWRVIVLVSFDWEIMRKRC